MSYTFRLRLNRSFSPTLNTDAPELKIAVQEQGISLFLRAVLPIGSTLKNAKQWVLVGEGYQSESDALRAGERFQDALTIACAKVQFGADIGFRSPKSAFSPQGLQSFFGEKFIDRWRAKSIRSICRYMRRRLVNCIGLLENIENSTFNVPNSPWRRHFLAFLREHKDKELLGRELKIRNNTHGLVAYPSTEQPVFVEVENFDKSLVVLMPLDRFEKAFAAAIALNHMLTERERVAFSLFNASFFQSTADGRFLLLVMAVEVLIDPSDESPDVGQKIEEFITDVNNTSIDEEDKELLAERLGYLRRESIGKAGRRLVKDRLGGRIYENKPAHKFFTEIYKLRSRLVHGLAPFPTFQEVNAIAASTQGFVSDLLTAPFLENP
jgi:hypothetical protein